MLKSKMRLSWFNEYQSCNVLCSTLYNYTHDILSGVMAHCACTNSGVFFVLCFSKRTLTMFEGVVTLCYLVLIMECHNSHCHSQSLLIGNIVLTFTSQTWMPTSVRCVPLILRGVVASCDWHMRASDWHMRASDWHMRANDWHKKSNCSWFLE